MSKVFGTMEVVPNIEINHNTVYIRTNVERVEKDGLQGWEYDEEKIHKDKFIEKIEFENAELKTNVVRLESLNTMLNEDFVSLTDALIEMGVI